MSSKVFVVSQNKKYLKEFSKILESSNFIVSSTAQDTSEALNVLSNIIPDVLIIDLELKGTLDVIETAKYLQFQYKIPIVFLTTENDKILLEKAKAASPNGFILQGSGKEEIERILDYAIKSYYKDLEKIRFSTTIEDNKRILEAIFKNSRDAIIFIDKKMKIFHWNYAAENVFGYSSKFAQGKNFCNLIILPQYFEEIYGAFSDLDIIGTNEIFDKTLEIYTKDKKGKIIPTETKLSPVFFKSDWWVCAIIRDVSDRINNENEMKKLIEEMQINKDMTEQNANELIKLNLMLQESELHLKELNANKDRFFSIISHDLKGPFQGLLGYSDIIINEFDKLDLEDIKSLSEDVNITAKNLFKLLENLLHWSRLQRGAIDYVPSDNRLYDLIKVNIDIAQARANFKKIKLFNNVIEDYVVNIDVNMINTVIRNLIANAIKFTNEGDEVSVNAYPTDNDMLIVSIEDTGVGMSEDVMQKLFKIGAKHTTLGTANEQGTGLGLILCKELVERNKGEIWVESEIGKGSKFKFTIPISEIE